MRTFRVFLYFLLLSFLFFGCSKSNLEKESIFEITTSLEDRGGSHDGISNIETDLEGGKDEKDIKKEYYFSEYENDFVLADIKQYDTINDIIELYGDPLDWSYTVRGEYKLQDQYLLTNMYYEDFIIGIRDFFKDGYEHTEGVVEVNINGVAYKTTRGISIGDTIDKVKKNYEINRTIDLNGDEQDIIKTDIYNKIHHLGAYTDDKFFYEYGNSEGYPDSLAYIEYLPDNEDGRLSPVLVFLFRDKVVTNILLYNTFHLHI